MDDLSRLHAGFGTAEARWAHFGPYYAIFPASFAFEAVEAYSEPGDKVLDPFCGRGTSVFAADALGRKGTGIEIQPLGWLYSSVKLHPAPKDAVLERLREICGMNGGYASEIGGLGEFFRMCFCDRVLAFLLAARESLDWRGGGADSTLMAFVAAYMHGKLGEALSNQMRPPKALGPRYSVEWWRKEGLETPPEIDPLEFLEKRIEWRYALGAPACSEGGVVLGDSREATAEMARNGDDGYSLLLTSPPYMGVTDYFCDQWLRLWLLGGPADPGCGSERPAGARLEGRERYEEMLDAVFGGCAALMRDDATICVRTDSRKATLDATVGVLRRTFPRHDMRVTDRPLAAGRKTQTAMLGNTSRSPGETDIVMTRY